MSLIQAPITRSEPWKEFIPTRQYHPLMTDDPETIANIRAARTVRGIPPDQYRVPFASVPALLEERARATPEKEFLIFYAGDGSREALTYAAFQARARRIAHQMSVTLGVRRGDRVATVSYNHPDTV